MISLTFEFEEGSKIPLYEQLYEYIKTEIKIGNLNAGEKLPSKRNLSSHLKISINTVETAYGQLLAEGYIKSIPKKGYFISKLEKLFSEIENLSPNIEIAKENIEEKIFDYNFKTNAVDIVSFPFATWARISKEIMHDQNKELLMMTHPQGDYNLREIISKYLHDFRGVNCVPEQIIIGAGTEYLFLLLIQILNENCKYALENPGYIKPSNILKSFNREINYINLDSDGMKINELEKSNSNIAYITPSHHFPLGIIMPIKRRMQLLKWANKSPDRFIIEDDYDSEFRFIGRPIPSLQGIDENQKVIYISTFSKIMSPSMRISYMVLPIELLKIYQEKLGFYSTTVSRFEQYTLYKFIKDGYFERHLNKMRNIYRNRKEKLVNEIKKSPYSKNIEIIGINSGLHLLLKFNGQIKEEELKKSAENIGIKIYGLSEYYLEDNDNIPDDTVILGFGDLKEEEIEIAIEKLFKAWFQ